MQKNNINLGISFYDLYTQCGLKKIDSIFLQYVKSKEKTIYDYLINSRNKNQFFGPKDHDNKLFLESAKLLEEFILVLFPNINYSIYQDKVNNLKNMFLFRQQFINKYVRQIDLDFLDKIDFFEVKKNVCNLLKINEFDEQIFMEEVLKWLKDKENNQEKLNIASLFGAFVYFQFKEGSNYQYKIFLRLKR